MTDEIRSKIAGKLAKGVKIEEIVNEIRNDMEKPLCRDKLVTRKDVHNVKHQFNVELLQKHRNDAQSVLCWIKELQMQLYDSILCHKSQGELT